MSQKNQRGIKQKDIQTPEIGRGKWEKDNPGRKDGLWTLASICVSHSHLSACGLVCFSWICNIKACFLRFIKRLWALCFVHHNILSKNSSINKHYWLLPCGIAHCGMCTLKEMLYSACLHISTFHILSRQLFVYIFFIFLLNQHSGIIITHFGAVLGREVETVPYMTQPSSCSKKLHLFATPPSFWPHCLGSITKYWRWQWLSPAY